jgi:hypothetical protein
MGGEISREMVMATYRIVALCPQDEHLMIIKYHGRIRPPLNPGIRLDFWAASSLKSDISLSILSLNPYRTQ